MMDTRERALPFGMPMISQEERQAVADVLAGPILVHGPRAEQFETDFAHWTGAPYAISVSSCTAGMHLIYFALGLGSGDEVIVPAQTHVATAHVVSLTGATPIFVDCERRTGNIDIAAIESRITPRTRAISVVHFLGMPVDMTTVNEIARRHKLFVLEDCALAVGARLDGVHTGLHGDAGVFSFYPVKHLTTAEGGMIITRNAELARKLRLLKAFGVNRTHSERTVPGTYDVTELGFNYRMSEIHAAIGIAQMQRIDAFNKQRVKNEAVLRAGLSGDSRFILLETTNGRFVSSHYCLSVMLAPDLSSRRTEIIRAINARGVGTSVYYPHPVPRLTYYRERAGYDPSAFANAAWISDCSIALPVGPHLDEADMQRIVSVLKETVR